MTAAAQTPDSASLGRVDPPLRPSDAAAPCEDCATAAINPRTCRYTADCRECNARSLAQSPCFWDSMQADALTPAYRSALRLFFGAEWVAGHSQVRAWAERLATTPLGAPT